jgi:uncharacterized membrane protein
MNKDTEVNMSTQVQSRGKRPLTKLAGPYGHPLHPLLVTVPIGAWVASFIFDIASRTSDSAKVFAEGAYWLIGLGVVTALLAAVWGLMDLFAIPRRTRAFRTGLLHLMFNVTTVVLFAISFLVRHSDDGYEKKTSIGLLILSAVALAVLTVSGWLGGRLAYRFGIRVIDEAAQEDGFRS